MKTKRFLGIFLALTLVFGILPLAVSAEAPATVYVGGVALSDGDFLAVGATEATKEAPVDGGYAYYSDGVIELYDYEYEGEGYAYYSYEDVEYPENSYKYTSVIYAEGYVTIKISGENSLINTTNESDGITLPSGGVIEGEGYLYINAEYAIYSYNETEGSIPNTIEISSGDIEIYGGYSGTF